MATNQLCDLGVLRDYILAETGIQFAESHGYLMERSLRPVLRKYDLASFSTLVLALKSPGNDAIRDDVLDAVTINETSFFRNEYPFDVLQKVMFPQLLEDRSSLQEIMIWSAACSTGQEAYSLAVTARLSLPSTWTTRILATDLSGEMVRRTKLGRYSDFEVSRGLSRPIRDEFFEYEPSCREWVARPTLRNMITAFRTNLVDGDSLLPRTDIVFLRNVLIYFDDAQKEKVLRRIHKTMPQDGYLVLGGGESLIGIDVPFDRFEFEQCVYWRPR